MLGTFVALDLETSGVNPIEDKIIEIGMVKLVDGVIKDKLHFLVNPNLKLSVQVKHLTGITDEMLAGEKKIEELLPIIKDFLFDYPLIGHNVIFDLNFLSIAFGRSLADPLPNKMFDTLELARIFLPQAPNHRLDTLAQLCDVQLPQHHRALEDAVASGLLAIKLIEMISDFEISLLNQLNDLLKMAHSPWVEVLHNVIVENAKNIFERKITNKTWLRPVEEKTIFLQYDETAKKNTINIKTEEIIEILGENGSLHKVIDRYEHRSQQIAMAKAVTNTLNKKGFLLAEAGTGTGKSMAYLLPAVLWCKKNHQRVVISTHTINLQEQLCNKDVPLLQSLEELNFKAVLVKGRNHYLCLREWNIAYKTQNLSPNEAKFFASILIWLTETSTGDRSELNFSREDLDLWRNICANRESCIGKSCPYYFQLCFVNRARRLAEQADILIANHSLVLSDIKTDSRVIPPYKILIVDEAHHLENTATEHLGTKVDRADVTRWVISINKICKKLSDTRIIAKSSHYCEMINKIKSNLSQVKEGSEVFFNQIFFFLQSHIQGREQNRYTLRLKKETDLSFIQIELENFLHRINKVSNLLKQFVEEICGNIFEEDADLIQELEVISESGFTLEKEIGFVCNCEDIENVHWIDANLKETESQNIALHAVPIEVGPLLYKQLYSNKDTVVFTSATLTVDGSFDYYIQRSGLNLVPSSLLQRLKVDSPFSYDKQSIFYVVNDLPIQNYFSEEEYIHSLADILVQIIDLFNGKTLVLFTAHRILKETYLRIKPVMEEKEILLLGHAIDGSRSRLVEQFKESKQAVLFGTSSFWEGLDIPGHDLSCVVLVKLPFWPPNIPIVEARLEKISKDKKDAFLNYSLPEAVIKFKQGFGRLIRSKFDRGAVIALDKRIIEKKYGQKFINSLPVKTHMRGDRKNMLKKIRNWLDKQD